MKKLLHNSLSLAIIFAFLLGSLNGFAFADNNKKVSISIPTFKVKIDETKVDSKRMQYPFIVYNNITYFPLTWNWCGKMGLSSSYTDKDGLYIAKHNMDREIPEKMDNGAYQPAGKKYTATVVNYPVFINGKKIDNTKEKYPLINFRHITYFPLTWRFVVDEFAWYQSWDKVNGLVIKTNYDANSEKVGVYDIVDYYVTNTYNDYATLKQSVETRKTTKTADGYSNSSVGTKGTLYKLNYQDDSFTKIYSETNNDTPYNSGKIKKEDAANMFSKDGTKINFNGNFLYDITNDAGANDTIDQMYASKYKVNDLDVYTLIVNTTQNGNQIPAPYTPYYQYVFVDKGDGKLIRINDWKIKTVVSAIYNNGKGGFYLCSNLSNEATTHSNAERARVYNVDKNLNVDILNDKWKDWKSVEAIGTDKDNNLYLINTWYAKANPDNNYEETVNLVSPINDGYFKLTPDGNLTKIHPYVEFDTAFVTANGKIYTDNGNDFSERGFYNLLADKWVRP